MSISSVGSNPALQQFLQSLNGSNQANQNPSLLETLGQDADGDQDGSVGSTTVLSGHHGRSHGLSAQLESAISSALQSSSGAAAGTGTSAGANDANQVIQQAITNFLSGSQTGTSGATTTNTSTAGTTSPTQSQAVFSQLLQSNGVDPEQFQQDLQTAIQNSQQSGQDINFASLFQNFPPGSLIDTTA